jgi:hypothetical protein
MGHITRHPFGYVVVMYGWRRGLGLSPDPTPRHQTIEPTNIDFYAITLTSTMWWPVVASWHLRSLWHSGRSPVRIRRPQKLFETKTN